MDIEVKFPGDKNAAARDRKSLSVETHLRRNETFVVQKVDNVLEGDSVTFSVPPGGRLIVSTPEVKEDLVYDREQGAAIRASAQKNDDGKADAPKVGDAVTNPQPRVETQQRRFEAGAPASNAPQPRPTMAATPTPTPARQLGELEKQKAEQQTASRPAGEKPPLPGSPAGSPPAGNEGKDNI